MHKQTECQYHNNCGGWCETPDEQAANLCSDCMDAEQMDADHQAAVAELRRALAFLDAARALPGATSEHAYEQLEAAARKVIG